MDSTEVLEDKDSGPEVQLNLPGSVMSRIEELMGGTEQFDSEEVCMMTKNVLRLLLYSLSTLLSKRITNISV